MYYQFFKAQTQVNFTFIDSFIVFKLTLAYKMAKYVFNRLFASSNVYNKTLSTVFCDSFRSLYSICESVYREHESDPLSFNADYL